MGEEPLITTEVEVRVIKLKIGNRKGKEEVTGEIIKGEGDMVVDWIWSLRNISCENGVVPDDKRSAVIVPLNKSKGETTECKNYRGNSLLSVVGKIYVGVLERLKVSSMINNRASEQEERVYFRS